jgi:hypothetical protein
MRIFGEKGRLDFTKLREKNPRIPIQIRSYETWEHFYQITRRHVLEVEILKYMLTATEALN